MLKRTVDAIFLLTMLGLFGLLQYRLWQPGGGCLLAYRLQREVKTQLAENAAWQEKNRILTEKLVWLNQDPQAIEHFARNELGMIKTGESFYMVIEKKD